MAIQTSFTIHKQFFCPSFMVHLIDEQIEATTRNNHSSRDIQTISFYHLSMRLCHRISGRPLNSLVTVPVSVKRFSLVGLYFPFRSVFVHWISHDSLRNAVTTLFLKLTRKP
ncbi:hypothetical protein CDAR_581241 [Caerostris darwini]|uniref:Uncharacterized protein n=1 Tax=Caerostris darwini TaxID=1538125 RepID=A0AAV4MJL5_9ARAC|nr:hypothetical protein CDAR_581241 [Caerostris darwini]